MMKILFLDIDGVLNSTRTCVAFGGYPMELEHGGAFDRVAVHLIRRLCDSAGVQIVLSSAWRNHYPFADVGKALGLPIIDKTGNALGSRGLQINQWLAEHHEEVERYAIVDDDSDMLAEQMPYFVHTQGHEGLTWANFTRLCELFGENPYSGEPRDRNWRTDGKVLDWEGWRP